ncbi:MAG: hypothetical protein AAF514_02385 [Verrucomicrobiota bacterium]
MTTEREKTTETSYSSDAFPPTQWQLVHEAGSGQTEAAERALSELCQTYWYPLYCFLRRSGLNPHDAEDRTQSFFQKLITENLLQGANKDRGRLRSFLLTSVKNFIRDEWRKETAIKRGGHLKAVSFEQSEAENRYLLEPVDTDSPENLYDQAWAYTILERALNHLRERYAEKGNAQRFSSLEPYLSAKDSKGSYRETARKMGMTEGAVRLAVFQLRKRYRIQLRREIASTVKNHEDIDRELDYLKKIFEN